MATVRVVQPSDYWSKVCAPKVRAVKRDLGRAVSNTAIAAAVEQRTGKNTSRQLVEAWFSGVREPYISQLIALCEYLELAPADVFLSKPTAQREPLFRAREGRQMNVIPSKIKRKRTIG